MPVKTSTDERHLARAIELAERGRSKVSPNPLAGAVIAADMQTISEGYHTAFGAPHAEVEAIRAAAGRELDSATLYVSLEPCCHRGKTPPCTDAILESGIRRVVVASDDPSEHASGRGLGILRDEGVEVVLAEGELASRARLLNQPFRKWAKTGRPWVLFKAAMTLDGKVATQGGDSKWISGDASRRRAHHWRAECDAVAVGIGTALADDPQLTARISDPAGWAGSDIRQPRRVVFDSLARLGSDSKLVSEAGRVPLTVVVSRAAPRGATDALETHGADVLVATGENEPARVRSGLVQLGVMGVSSILLEGGPHLAGAFLDAHEIDELRLFLAPMVLGGRTSRAALEGEGVESIADAVKGLTLECERVGEDLLISARLKEW
jgi:diaminohydroxyphosphoribosylaminopyrimidine deaminase/5-amino-6-(5-phosphoribosylamino)uracil reductase